MQETISEREKRRLKRACVFLLFLVIVFFGCQWTLGPSERLQSAWRRPHTLRLTSSLQHSPELGALRCAGQHPCPSPRSQAGSPSEEESLPAREDCPQVHLQRKQRRQNGRWFMIAPLNLNDQCWAATQAKTLGTYRFYGMNYMNGRGECVSPSTPSDIRGEGLHGLAPACQQ